MAKAYAWSDTTWQISPTGGTSGDPITFKDITDYFEANPLPLDYNIPRYLGGLVYILGDQNTFTGVAGDTIKVTIDGTDYDDIDIAAATSIANVVTAINAVISGTPASSSGGFLKIESPSEEYDSGEVQIDDGTSTVNPCVARLFSVANNRDSTNFTFPYELTENNASEWSEIGGFLTPTDDAVDFCNGMASVTAEVDSVPTGTNITRVNAQSLFIYVYMADTSAFALYDEVIITGTANFDGVIFRIVAILANTYVYGYTSRDCPIVDETGITGATLITPLTLGWNTDISLGYRSITIANKIRFSAKSDGAGSPKIIGVVVRNRVAGGITNNFAGAYIKLDYDLTSDWQDFEIDIRGMKNYNWGTYGGGYWYAFQTFFIMFDGVAVGENVWIDGVRFTCTDRNPKRYSEDNYVFPVALNLVSWFKDYGFNVRFDLLEGFGGSYSYHVLKAVATNVDEIQFGDYGVGYDGAVFIFNSFCMKDEGSITFTKCQLQSLMIIGHKDQQSIPEILGNNNAFSHCSFNACLFGNDSQSNSIFDNILWIKGLRFLYFPPDDVVIDGLLTVGTGLLFHIWAFETPLEVRNVKSIGGTSIAWHQYGFSDTNQQGVRFINLDVSECSNPYIEVRRPYPYSISDYISFSFNLKIIDNLGNDINAATVILKDKDDNQLFSVTTDVNGVITEQIVDMLKLYYDVYAFKQFYFNTPLVDWIHYYPFTLIIKKQGYMTYKQTFMPAYSKDLDIVKNGINWEITLQPEHRLFDQLNG